MVALGLGTACALLAAPQRVIAVFIEVLGATVLYAALLLLESGTPQNLARRRLLASFGYVIWFYCAVARIVPALGATLRDPALLAIDVAVFGQTPATYCERMGAWWLTDLMSFCYMTYHLYLFVVVAAAARVLEGASQRLSPPLFMGFAVGFAGYLLVPAVGPAHAYPELFHGALPGGTLSRWIGEIVALGSSGYDVFPSLHVLITCILLDHDWREHRRRFWIFVCPAVGLLVSTIYLRYHYGVDLLTGLLLFLALRQTALNRGTRNVGLPK